MSLLASLLSGLATPQRRFSHKVARIGRGLGQWVAMPLGELAAPAQGGFFNHFSFIPCLDRLLAQVPEGPIWLLGDICKLVAQHGIGSLSTYGRSPPTLARAVEWSATAIRSEFQRLRALYLTGCLPHQRFPVPAYNKIVHCHLWLHFQEADLGNVWSRKVPQPVVV